MEAATNERKSREHLQNVLGRKQYADSLSKKIIKFNLLVRYLALSVYIFLI